MVRGKSSAPNSFGKSSSVSLSSFVHRALSRGGKLLELVVIDIGCSVGRKLASAFLRLGVVVSEQSGGVSAGSAQRATFADGRLAQWACPARGLRARGVEG